MLPLPREVFLRFRKFLRRVNPIGSVRLFADNKHWHMVGGTAEVLIGYTGPATTEVCDGGLPAEFFSWLETSTVENVSITWRATEQSWVCQVGDQDHLFSSGTEALPEWPLLPECWSDADPVLLPALHDASRCAEREAGPRWSMHRIQLNGARGQIIGTDSKQLLIHDGFDSPFAETILIPASPIFGTPEWRKGSARWGRTTSHLVLTVGPWTLAFTIDTRGKFPDVFAAIPKSLHPTTISLKERDARTLNTHLKQCSPDPEFPITLDTRAERITIRHQNPSTHSITEVPFLTLRATGPPVQVACLRSYWLRALEMGFRQITLHGAHKPMLFHADHRRYLVMTLDSTAVVQAAPNALLAEPSRRRKPIRLATTTPLLEKSMPLPNSHPPPNPGDDALDPLAEAEAVRQLLAEATQRITQLVQLLKAKRKAYRAISQAVRSLQALPLLGKE